MASLIVATLMIIFISVYSEYRVFKEKLRADNNRQALTKAVEAGNSAIDDYNLLVEHYNAMKEEYNTMVDILEDNFMREEIDLMYLEKKFGQKER